MDASHVLTVARIGRWTSEDDGERQFAQLKNLVSTVRSCPSAPPLSLPMRHVDGVGICVDARNAADCRSSPAIVTRHTPAAPCPSPNPDGVYTREATDFGNTNISRRLPPHDGSTEQPVCPLVAREYVLPAADGAPF